jgi:hypothetical protein
MTLDSKCKFCQRPVSLVISDDYPGVFAALVPLAACNRCSDLKERERRITEALESACARVLGNRRPSKEWLEKERDIMTKLSKAYVRFVGEWCGVPELGWEEDLVNQLMEHPAQIGAITRTIWTTARDSKRLL